MVGTIGRFGCWVHDPNEHLFAYIRHWRDEGHSPRIYQNYRLTEKTGITNCKDAMEFVIMNVSMLFAMEL